MKKTLLLLGAGIISFTSNAQSTISNQSFESWQNIVVKDSLDEWMTSTLQYQMQGIMDVNNAYKITPGYATVSAIHLETVLWYDQGAGMNDTLFGYAIKNAAGGSGFDGFPYSDTVDVFKCWYKCGIVGGDQGIIIIELSNNGIVYSSTTYPIVGSVGTWTQLTIPLINGATEVPDSVFVGFASSDPFNPGVAAPGSWLEVDELSFEFLSGSTVPAAIPNNSFENWTTETISQPQSWYSFDPIMFNTTGQVYVTQSATASHLSSSAQIETTFENIMYNIPSLLTNGFYIIGNDSLMGGSPFNAQPAQFTGDFQYSGIFSDTAWVYVKFWNSGTGFLLEAMDTLLDAASWTTFSIDLTFTEAPDSVLVLFFSGNNIGSTLLVDHLQFVGGDVSTPEFTANAANLVVYPNPSNDQATILFQNADVINVMDLNGKLISQITNFPGNKIDLNTSDWENGIYIIQLINDGKVEAKKLTVQH